MGGSGLGGEWESTLDLVRQNEQVYMIAKFSVHNVRIGA